MQYLHMGDIASRVRTALSAGLIRLEQALPEERRQPLRQALDHLGEVREGFVISVRAGDAASLEELRYLLQRVILGWEWLEEQGLALQPAAVVEVPAWQRVAFAHSYVSLGLLPRLSPHLITYPMGRRSYADIPVPRSPAEVLGRIEELERALSLVEARPLAELDESTLKRTYGFFETSAWLVDYHRQLFLGEA